ncbi:dual specificity protein phosphatase MPK-4, partial [Bacillus rossius redtenbacheri]|uniref:dual specificity protein phosphatase MPK-4 n=1 Tax=Bacillus rossius redtenbacheri TaxID=93214 RepID=UPI002FDDF5AC
PAEGWKEVPRQKTHSKHKGAFVTLAREDFDAGPTNLDRIEEGLWLGNLTAATNVEVLQSHRIDHIVTVDSCPLPKKITMLPGVNTMYIQVTDLPREDLLTYFEETFEFIKEGQAKGVVLVHCYFGVSRSATIVIAYVMKKYQLSFADAFERVKAQRQYVGPNPGFQSQLRLYHGMGWRLDRANLQFRMFRLQVAADYVKKAKILPQNCMDVVRPDPSLITVRPDPLVYRCRKCRRILASASNLLPHRPKERPLWADESWSVPGPTDQAVCAQTHFVEPIAWMQPVYQSLQGKLQCPTCRSKLGSFSWVMGCQCPCGSRISPAFYLVPSKVEWSNFVQNVQVTV